MWRTVPDGPAGHHRPRAGCRYPAGPPEIVILWGVYLPNPRTATLKKAAMPIPGGFGPDRNRLGLRHALSAPCSYALGSAITQRA
jgi:hypothetical protein